MPEYLSPGVYLEEIEAGQKPIKGVATSSLRIVGESERGPEDIRLICSYAEFQRDTRRTLGIGTKQLSVNTGYLL